LTLFHNKEPGVARCVRALLWAAGQGCLVGEVLPGHGGVCAARLLSPNQREGLLLGC
jgi:hypothetical protein